MTVDEKIEAALLARVGTLSTTPSLPVALPNAYFEPPPDARYLRVSHLRNRNERLFTKGASPHLRQGILQLTVVCPRNEGGSIGLGLAGAIAEHFPAGLGMQEQDARVTVQAAPDVHTGLETDVSWDIAVSIRYQAFA